MLSTANTCRILGLQDGRSGCPWGSRGLADFSLIRTESSSSFFLFPAWSWKLKLFTVFAVTVVSSNIFHFEITQKEKSTSSHLYYIDTWSVSRNDPEFVEMYQDETSHPEKQQLNRVLFWRLLLDQHDFDVPLMSRVLTDGVSHYDRDQKPGNSLVNLRCTFSKSSLSFT